MEIAATVSQCDDIAAHNTVDMQTAYPPVHFPISLLPLKNLTVAKILLFNRIWRRRFLSLIDLMAKPVAAIARSTFEQNERVD